MIAPAALAAVLIAGWQSASPAPSASFYSPSRDELRAGLDILYHGHFERAALRFETLAARDTLDAGPVVFQAGAYLWWGEALNLETFEGDRIDSLLELAIHRAGIAGDTFWLATAYGYRARQRELHGSGLGAAKDAKRMRGAYRQLLAADSSRADCYLGLGLYEYGLARVGGVSRFFAKVLGLGSGNAERGIQYLRRAAAEGDLARVEATWVLASALAREAVRASAGGRSVFREEARAHVTRLRRRYPENRVFIRFLEELPLP